MSERHDMRYNENLHRVANYGGIDGDSYNPNHFRFARYSGLPRDYYRARNTARLVGWCLATFGLWMIGYALWVGV